MRKMTPDGSCVCCGHIGAVWTTLVRSPDGTVPADPGPGTDPPLCDRCQYAQQRWDAWQYGLRCPGAGYPYADGPPLTPPVRREPLTGDFGA
ncbi:MAG TPA: hypothetical protein VGE74_31050 [Gemmata sp.]